MKIIITETKDRTHKQSMRFFCLLFYRKPTLSEVCWASLAPVTSPVTHTRFAVGFTRWHSADRKLQVANRRSISNLYQTQVWYLKISDLGEAEVWYLVVNEWLKVHYVFKMAATACTYILVQIATQCTISFWSKNQVNERMVVSRLVSRKIQCTPPLPLPLPIT